MAIDGPFAYEKVKGLFDDLSEKDFPGFRVRAIGNGRGLRPVIEFMLKKPDNV